jgi:hypothetical protein
MRGVNFMADGFIQNALSAISFATYVTAPLPGGTAFISENTVQIRKPTLDTLTSGVVTELPWYDPRSNGLYKGSYPTDEVLENLSVDDSPFLVVPRATTTNSRGATVTLSNLLIDWTFAMYVAAETTDNTAIDVNPVFTQLARGTWEFDGDGAITVAGATLSFTPSAPHPFSTVVHCLIPGNFVTDIPAGTTVPATGGEPFNIGLKTNSWGPVH